MLSSPRALRAVAVSLSFASMLATAASAQAVSDISVTTRAGDHLVLQLAVTDHGAPETSAVSALVVSIDGRAAQHVLLFPGTGVRTYETLVGPLDEGTYRLAVEPSPFWKPNDRIVVNGLSARVVSEEQDAGGVIAYAPTLGVRADTIGTASDLPLVMYVEDQRTDGTGWVRYTVIFSHEDGGTTGPALMARWGRTTDIELVTEVEWRDGRVVQQRFQGPNHEMRPFAGTTEGRHPYLLAAAFNNIFLDRGLSVASVRLVPELVSLASATRESVMDAHPWTYTVMARELVSEGRVAAVGDPRDFLYVEARLTLDNAAASVRAKVGEGQWADSTLERAELAITRNGWVRIAVRSAAAASELQWECRALQGGQGSESARCDIEMTRAFRLDAAYQPGPNRVAPARVTLGAGLSDPVQLGTR